MVKPMTSLVYFSSASENTHRFVQRLGLPATRIPLHDRDGTFEVDEPYVLILPTYGGGITTRQGRDTSYVPEAGHPIPQQPSTTGR